MDTANTNRPRNAEEATETFGTIQSNGSDSGSRRLPLC